MSALIAPLPSNNLSSSDDGNAPRYEYYNYHLSMIEHNNYHYDERNDDDDSPDQTGATTAQHDDHDTAEQAHLPSEDDDNDEDSDDPNNHSFSPRNGKGDNEISPVEEDEGMLQRNDSSSASQHRTPTTTSNRRTKRATAAMCLIFCFVMFGSAIAVALVVFYYTRRAEQEQFEKQFRSDATKILQSIAEFFDRSLSAMDSFVAMVVAQKNALNATFPLVKIENFALQAAKYKTLTKCFTMGTHYLVTDEDRSAWEAFAAENNQFVSEAWALLAHDETFQGSMEKMPRIEPRIFANFPSLSDRPEDSGPYLVQWGVYPIIYEEYSAPYNYDIFAVPFLAKRWLPVLETYKPTMSRFSQVIEPGTTEFRPDELVGINYVRNFIPPTENPAEPFNILIYPIIDRSENLRIDPSTVTDEQLVGTLSHSWFWRDLLRDILPPKSQGIHVVTENPCGQAFTYEVNGAETKYISSSDVHESRYDHLQMTATLKSILDTSNHAGSSYTGMPLADFECPITIRISPSQKNEDIYLSKDPVIFAVGAGLIFFLTGGLFLVYDYLVDRGRIIFN